LPGKVRDAERRCPQAGRVWSTFGPHAIRTERSLSVRHSHRSQMRSRGNRPGCRTLIRMRPRLERHQAPADSLTRIDPFVEPQDRTKQNKEKQSKNTCPAVAEENLHSSREFRPDPGWADPPDSSNALHTAARRPKDRRVIPVCVTRPIRRASSLSVLKSRFNGGAS
jgi:hypothetical protein